MAQIGELAPLIHVLLCQVSVRFINFVLYLDFTNVSLGSLEPRQFPHNVRWFKEVFLERHLHTEFTRRPHLT